MTTPLGSSTVQRVQQALIDAGSPAQIRALAETARSAQEAADTLGVALGAIVKSLVFVVGEQPVMALVAGDRRCDTQALGNALSLPGRVRRADADLVRAATGFAIGGVAPMGHPRPLPTGIDRSLQRFTEIYAAAGHPFCVFPTTLEELVRITGGTLSDRIGQAPPSA